MSTKEPAGKARRENHSLMKLKPLLKLIKAPALGLGAVLYLIILAGSIYEAAVYPRVPQRVPLAQAVEMDSRHTPDFLVFDRALYVSISDAAWDCASVKHSGYQTVFSDKRRTDAVFSDAQKSAVVFIQVDGFYTCKELQSLEIAGELQRLEARPIVYSNGMGGMILIDETSETPAYRFCTHCSPFHAVSLALVFALFPFAAWGWMAYQKRRSRARSAAPGKAGCCIIWG